MASFPLFPLFHVELQAAIWAAHVADLGPEPEVCIVWPLSIPAIGMHSCGIGSGRAPAASSGLGEPRWLTLLRRSCEPG